jgi:hypothetical protein
VKPAAVRLAIAAAAFLGWIGYLAYLVVATQGAVVLSRPQMLVSDAVVVATVAPDLQTVMVKQVLFGSAELQALQDKEITVVGLRDAEIPAAGKWKPSGAEPNETYLLPIQSAPSRNPTDDKPRFRLTPLPPSPGYPPYNPKTGTADSPAVRIYPANERIIKQFRSITP